MNPDTTLKQPEPLPPAMETLVMKRVRDRRSATSRGSAAASNREAYR